MNELQHPDRMNVRAIQAELNELADRHNNRQARKAKFDWGTPGDREREAADEARQEALTAELSARNEQRKFNLGPSGIDPEEMIKLTEGHVDINNMGPK